MARLPPNLGAGRDSCHTHTPGWLGTHKFFSSRGFFKSCSVRFVRPSWFSMTLRGTGGQQSLLSHSSPQHLPLCHTCGQELPLERWEGGGWGVPAWLAPQGPPCPHKDQAQGRVAERQSPPHFQRATGTHPNPPLDLLCILLAPEGP